MHLNGQSCIYLSKQSNLQPALVLIQHISVVFTFQNKAIYNGMMEFSGAEMVVFTFQNKAIYNSHTVSLLFLANS